MPFAAARTSSLDPADTWPRTCFRLHCFMLALLLAPAALSAARASTGPAFDCRKASSASEKAICASEELGRLDRQQQQAWKAMNSALQEHPQHAALKQDQLAWLKTRDRCMADTACITEAYQGRLSQLQGGGSLPWA